MFVKKILQLFPSAVDEIGREAVSRRFLDLWEDLWDLGHKHLDCFELLKARYTPKLERLCLLPVNVASYPGAQGVAPDQRSGP